MKANRVLLVSIFVLASVAMVSYASGYIGGNASSPVAAVSSASTERGELLARGGGHGGSRGRDHAEDSSFHRSNGHHDGFDDNGFRSDDFGFGSDDSGHHGGFDDSFHSHEGFDDSGHH